MVSRRNLLRTLSGSFAVGVAGCNVLTDASGPETDSPIDGSGNSTPTATPTATLAPETAGQGGSTTPTVTATSTASPTPMQTDTPTPDVPRVRSGSPVTPGEARDSSGFGATVALSDDVALVGVDGERVHIFEAGDDSWQRTTTLALGDADGYSSLPLSMALDGDTAIIGSVGHEDAGAVDVFEPVDDEWTRRAHVTPDADPSEYRMFGRSVAYDGVRLVVGAAGPPSMERSNDGNVYVFEGSGDDWTQTANVTTEHADTLGQSVSVSGDTILAGAPFRGSYGVAVVYQFSDGEWRHQTQLRLEDQNRTFGEQVALDGDTAVVGGYDSDDGGILYVFERSDGAWERADRVAGLSGIGGELDGPRLAFENDVALVGNPRAADSPHVSRIEATVDGWERTARLVPKTRRADSVFGWSLALDGSAALVGAPSGNQDRSGRGYLFDL